AFLEVYFEAAAAGAHVAGRAFQLVRARYRWVLRVRFQPIRLASCPPPPPESRREPPCRHQETPKNERRIIARKAWLQRYCGACRAVSSKPSTRPDLLARR